MATPNKCPICKGCGKVGFNFYKDADGIGISEKCRTCEGKGIIWDFYTTQILPIRVNTPTYNPCDNCSVRQNPNWNGICQCTLPCMFNSKISW